jgi:hypothetical protein
MIKIINAYIEDRPDHLLLILIILPMQHNAFDLKE